MLAGGRTIPSGWASRPQGLVQVGDVTAAHLGQEVATGVRNPPAWLTATTPRNVVTDTPAGVQGWLLPAGSHVHAPCAVRVRAGPSAPWWVARAMGS